MCANETHADTHAYEARVTTWKGFVSELALPLHLRSRISYQSDYISNLLEADYDTRCITRESRGEWHNETKFRLPHFSLVFSYSDEAECKSWPVVCRTPDYLWPRPSVSGKIYHFVQSLQWRLEKPIANFFHSPPPTWSANYFQCTSKV